MSYKPIRRKTLVILTVVWLLTFIYTFTLGNPPQCPLDYTQAQVDASNCIIGANIGAGMLVMFVLVPLFVILLGSWAIYFIQQNRNKK